MMLLANNETNVKYNRQQNGIPYKYISSILYSWEVTGIDGKVPTDTHIPLHSKLQQLVWYGIYVEIETNETNRMEIV